MAGSRFDPEFYSLVAQVLPVFFLVIVAELRLGNTRGQVQLGPALWAVAMILFMFAAEVIALEAVADARRPSGFERGVLHTGMGSALVLPVYLWVRDLFEGWRLPTGRRTTAVVRLLPLVVLIGVVLAVSRGVSPGSATALIAQLFLIVPFAVWVAGFAWKAPGGSSTTEQQPVDRAPTDASSRPGKSGPGE
jgi:hypothetical protein